MRKSKYQILAISFFSLMGFSFADNTNISKNIIESASEGRNVVKEQELNPIDINKEKIGHFIVKPY